MESIKKITLPKGWVIDKIENGEIILKEDNNPIIKWNSEKDGVEVIADGYHFVVANIPDMCTSWDKANIICEKWGGYLPSVEELKVIVKYIKEINQCFKNKNSPVCLLDTHYYYWSSSEFSGSRACYVNTENGTVYNCNKCNANNVRAFLRL